MANTINSNDLLKSYLLANGVNEASLNTMVREYLSSGGGTPTVSWNDITDKPSFSTVATTGNYLDLSNVPSASYLYASISTTIVGQGNGSDLVFDSVVNSGGSAISLDTSTGIVTLAPGSAYYIQATVDTYQYSLDSGWSIYRWVNPATNNPYSGSGGSSNIPATHTSADSPQPTASMVFSPSSSLQVKLRCTDNNGTHDIQVPGTSLYVVEILQ